MSLNPAEIPAPKPYDYHREGRPDSLDLVSEAVLERESFIVEQFDTINRTARDLSYHVVLARIAEWHSLGSLIARRHVLTENRRATGYFASARDLQEITDSLFTNLLPKEAMETAQAFVTRFGTKAEQWDEVTFLTRQVSRILGEPTLADYQQTLLDAARQEHQESGEDFRRIVDYSNAFKFWDGKPSPMIVHGRAKADSSLYRKMYKYSLKPHEVFDVLGVQVIAVNDFDARKMGDQLVASGEFKLMPSHTFEIKKGLGSRTEYVHVPDKDRLLTGDSWPDPFEEKLEGVKYRSRRINFLYVPKGRNSEVPFEVQFCPIDVWRTPKEWEQTTMNLDHK